MTVTPRTGPRAEPVLAPALVELVVPAQPAYLAVLRTASAGLAARLDLDLDEIEDLRIAIDEASTLLLHGAAAGDQLRAVFALDDDSMTIEVSGPAPSLPERSSIAWTVLEALAGQVEAKDAVAGMPSLVTMRHQRRRRKQST